MVGIISNAAAAGAQANLRKANDMAIASISRLSSGNRIDRAATDAAALSVGTVLKTNVSTLTTALNNAANGKSVLGVVDGSLQNIGNVLQRQKAIATQANNGALGDTQRGFLNQEFQELVQQIDQIANGTSFNGVKLIDGSLYNPTTVSTYTRDNSSETKAVLKLTGTGANGDYMVMNGAKFTFRTNSAAFSGSSPMQFALGTTASESATNLYGAIQSTINTTDSSYFDERALLSQFDYELNGDSIIMTAKSGGIINNATLFTGSLSAAATVNGTSIANTTIMAASANSVDLTATATAVAGDTLTINGITLTAVANAATPTSVQFKIGSSAAETTANIASTIDGLVTSGTDPQKAALGIYNYTYVTGGSTITMTPASGSTLTGFTASASASASFALEGVYLNGSSMAVSGLNNNTVSGSDGDLAAGTFANTTATTAATGTTAYSGTATTIAQGTVGDSILSAINTTGATVSMGISSTQTLETAAITFSAKAVALDTITINGVALVEGTDFAAGADATATAANLATALGLETALSEYTFSANAGVLTITSTDALHNLVVTGTSNSTGTLNGSTLVSATVVVKTDPGANVSSGTNSTGVNASSVSNNSAFVGKLSGFNATYIQDDFFNLELTVGDYTYQAKNVKSTPGTAGASTIVRMASIDAGGGYFDLELNTGTTSGLTTAITDQAGANTIATRLDRAFEEVDFFQKRTISSYVAAGNIYPTDSTTSSGSLVGTTFKMINNDFSSVSIESITVSAPVSGGTESVIEFVVDGETYRSGYDGVGYASSLGTSIANGTTIGLVNTSDPRKIITFANNSGAAISITSTAEAEGLQKSLERAFGVGQSGSALSFQVGLNSTDTLEVGLQGSRTADLYKDSSGNAVVGLNVSTRTDAIAASAVLDNAIQSIVSLRAGVGALQSRFDYAAANIESSQANLDAARGSFLDADIEVESTNFASAQVRMQASIAVLAQANQMPLSLLKLIS